MTTETEKFAEIRRKCRTPEYFRNAWVNFVGQFCHALKVKPKWLNPIFREAVSKVQPAFGWRKEIFKHWRKTVYKELRIEKLKGRAPYYNLGNACGIFTNITTTSFVEWGDDDDEFDNAVFAPFLNLEKEVLEKIANEFQKQLDFNDRMRQQAFTLPSSQQKEFSLGYSQGVDALFDDKGNLTYPNTTTYIYEFLLMLGDGMAELRSVDEVYKFARVVIGKDLFHSEEAFKQICHRIGFRGATYCKAMRRKRSIVRVKAARIQI